jgi:RNA polymerase sigma-70 factor (ECF subfamily)
MVLPVPPSNSPPSAWPLHQAAFVTTHWSVVQAAGAGDSTAGAALETLCRSYWPPIYAFVRRFGHEPEDARDLTQDFFQRLVERNYPGQADPRKGRFRTFLLITLNHFLLDQRERQCAKKRGGGQEPISFDAATEEERLALEPLDELTPETLFERRWARAILEDAERRLRAEFAAGNQATQWEVLQNFLPGEQGSLSYAEAATRLGVAENTLKSKIHRMRLRHRELVRAIVAETVATPAEVEDELRHLIAVLAA